MSRGHFDYQQWRIRKTAGIIERDIARALRPKPDMVHEDYWIINKMDYPHSIHSVAKHRRFSSREEAEAYLLRRFKNVVKAEPQYIGGRFFQDETETVFQSTKSYMRGVPRGERVPVLYAIHHCVFDHYPYDADVLELNDSTIRTMKEAYRQIRIAEIYAGHVEWVMSGDDGEDTVRERLKEDLVAFEKEYVSKDWTDFHNDFDEYDEWFEEEISCRHSLWM
jgi:hypothetical protein